MCLSLLGGHTSYRVFVKEDYCFIGPMPHILSEFQEIAYYSIEPAIDRNEIKDFEKCREILKNVFKLEKDKNIKELIIYLQGVSEGILKNKHIEEAIQFVKKTLVKKNPVVLSGAELQDLISKVKLIIGAVEIDLMKVYQEFEKKLPTS